MLARWGGTTGDPILVHGHLDVVPADADDWQLHPFSGEIHEGQVWGRGAVDMKDFDAMLLSTVRARARAGVVPDRPLVLCFTADEEAGGTRAPGRWSRPSASGSRTARTPSARSAGSPRPCAAGGST